MIVVVVVVVVVVKYYYLLPRPTVYSSVFYLLRVRSRLFIYLSVVVVVVSIVSVVYDV